MKLFTFLFLFASTSAFANCNVDKLRKEMLAAYTRELPVNDEKGGTGVAKAKNIVVSDYLMKVEADNFLMANFDLDIIWKNGKAQTVKSMAVSTVDVNTCTLQPFKTGNPLIDSLSSN